MISPHKVMLPPCDMDPTIYYVSFPCGSGKSYNLIEYMRQNRDQHNSLVLVKNLRLAHEYAANIRTKCRPGSTSNDDFPTVITAQSLGGARRALEKLSQICGSEGQIVVATQQNYINGAEIWKRENWNIVLDEIPQCDQFFSYPLKRFGWILQRLFKVERHTDRLWRVRANTNLRPLVAERDQDSAVEQLRGVIEAVASPYYDVFVEAS